MTRVLIVDDKEDNLYYLRALLEGSGFEVDVARHGAEALVKGRARVPGLVVSDLLMPVMDGYTLLRHWRADPLLRPVPFVVYTATYTEPQDEQLAMSLGADAFILKPAEPEDFLARIRDVQSRAAKPLEEPPSPPTGDNSELLKVYSQTLIRKLEGKTIQLEDANRALQRDIGDRKTAEISLRETEQRFRMLAENINEVFWITDPEADRITYISPAFEKIWGRPASDFLAKRSTFLESIHPEDRPRMASVAACQGAAGYDEIYRIVRPDGTARWIRDRASPVHDEARGKRWIVGTSEDITERRLAEDRIKEQATLLDRAHDAIFVKDLDDHIVYWNKGAERTYGWTSDEAVGRSSRELLYRDSSRFDQVQSEFLDRGEWHGEIVKHTKDGRPIVVDVSWTLVRDDQGRPKAVLAIDADITEQKRLQEQFLRAQRMESIGTLAGGIAHDLNNILAPILMGIELLKDLATDEGARHVVDTIERSARRGSDLVKQVLSFARGVEGAKVSVRLGEIVRDVEAIVRNTFPKNVLLRSSIPDDLWPVLGDPTQINQVLLNLCVNARDAMPRGGHLTLKASNATVGAGKSGARQALAAGPYVVVEVEDTGCGMPPDVVDRIFEPFFTTKDLGKGTGLGLSTVMGIVRSHGGTVEVRSEPGVGSVFTIYLRAQDGPATFADPDVGGERLPRGNGELVMLVEDEASIRDITRKTLESYGYRVVTAADGAQAVGLYALHREQIAVVLTDMSMPVMDGPALISALRRINPRLPIIAASGLNAHGDVERASAAGARHFLAKPCSTEAVLSKLKAVLVERAHESATRPPF
ncbi:blue-light-activated protein [mine drainage metagenome]|uniref:Blue-light-activated protein n=1 Tax=mine drainage metagenome TaxID=410659 RepID=A0A1J5SM41_9ZZZZ